MLQVLEPVAVYAVPEDLSALLIGREKVVVDSDSLERFLDEKVDKGLVFPRTTSAVPDCNTSFVTVSNRIV